jgi:hypothetical protein
MLAAPRVHHLRIQFNFILHARSRNTSKWLLLGPSESHKAPNAPVLHLSRGTCIPNLRAPRIDTPSLKPDSAGAVAGL